MGRHETQPAAWRRGQPEALLIYKKSKLSLYVHERKNPHFSALLEQGDASVEQLHAAHEAHEAALVAVKSALAAAGVPFRTRYRARMTAEDSVGRLVITVGGDGTLLDASRRIGADGVVLGVNSDPARSVGFLCAARADDFPARLDEVLQGSLHPSPVARLGGELDGQPLPFLILNDVLVAHRNPAATTRYEISGGERTELHKSSGIWICGPAGSTAAVSSAGGQIQDLDDARIQVCVREPYWTDGDRPALTHFFVPTGGTLVVQSRMREGMLYLDGPHQKLSFPFGATLRLHSRGAPLCLFVTDEMIRRRHAMQALRARYAGACSAT